MQPTIIVMLAAMAISSFWNIFELKKAPAPTQEINIPQVEQAVQGEVPQVVPEVVSVTAPAKMPAKTIVKAPPAAPKSIPQIAAPKPAASLPKPVVVSPALIDTAITYGPITNEVIDRTNRVVFEFGAVVLSPAATGTISFETRVDGLDEKWQETAEPKRTIDFPSGPREYTFYVRAKIKDKDITDPTPAKRVFKINISPFFGKVKIAGITPPTVSLTPSLIRITTNLTKDERANITGWEIKGSKGGFIVPQGIETYNPLVSPLTSRDIIIKQGDTIYVSGSANPIAGNNGNFRINKCTGYLTADHKFSIPIEKNCPKPEREKLPRYLYVSCKDYIMGLASCEVPTAQGMARYDTLSDSECLSYLTSTFNYPACFARYSQDSDFTGKEWHIYMNRLEKEIMDRDSDIVYLRDSQGLLIDKYRYGQPQCKQYCE